MRISRFFITFILTALALAWHIPSNAQTAIKSDKPLQACSHPDLDYSRFDACCAEGHTLSCAKAEVYKPNPDIEKLRQYCYSHQIVEACTEYLSRRERQEKQAQKKAAQPSDADKKPEVCDEKSARYNQDACRKEASKVLMNEMANTLGSMYDAPIVQSAALLNEKAALCQNMKNAELCDLAINGHWESKRYSESLQLLQFSCTQVNKERCETYERLKPYAEALKAGGQDSTALPCGTYAGEGVLLSELKFSDYGKVGTGLQGMRARLENGNVHIRHDKGGDFIYRKISPTAYIGLDTWNRHGILKQTQVATCKAPKTYQEKPLSNDCPSIDAKELTTCCANGSSQACNILGNQAMLTGKPKQAVDFYSKSCAQGVRISCENITTIALKSGPEHLTALRTVCAAHPDGVACEVADTVNPDYVTMLHGLNKLGDDLEKEDRVKGQVKGKKKRPSGQ